MNRKDYLHPFTLVTALGLASVGGCFSLDDSTSSREPDAGSAAGSTGSGGTGQGGAMGSGGAGGSNGGAGGSAGGNVDSGSNTGGAGGNAGTNSAGGSGGVGAMGGAAGNPGASGSSGMGGQSGAGGVGGTGGSAGAGGRAGAGGTAGSGGAGGKSGGAGAGAVGGAAGGTADGGGTSGAPTAAQLLALVQNCASVVSTHKYANDEGGSASIDICALLGAVFWKGDMDIDCDGRDIGDGKCPGNDCCYQPQTAYTNKSGMPLAASVTPYVVVPNDFKYTGLKGGTVVAVIYNNKLQYAVLGDTGPDTIIGEASYACAEKLGINPDPGNGGTGSGVTYIAFVGTGTVPADIENLTETQTLGEKLAAQLILSNKPD